jgi:trans-aconitate methyltransferase
MIQKQCVGIDSTSSRIAKAVESKIDCHRVLSATQDVHGNSIYDLLFRNVAVWVCVPRRIQKPM